MKLLKIICHNEENIIKVSCGYLIRLPRRIFNTPRNNKKAAMFGLDARIALAIFGALSVISGAALYSAIQDSKATSVMTEVQEIGKAWEQYLLDTGTDLPAYDFSNSTTKYIRDMTGLIKNTGVSGWKGPYLSYEEYSTAKYLKYPGANAITLFSAYDSAFGAGTSWETKKCSGSASCYLWVYISTFDEATYKLMDDKFDNGDGKTAGNIRYEDPSDVLEVKYTAYGPPVN